MNGMRSTPGPASAPDGESLESLDAITPKSPEDSLDSLPTISTKSLSPVKSSRLSSWLKSSQTSSASEGKTEAAEFNIIVIQGSDGLAGT